MVLEESQGYHPVVIVLAEIQDGNQIDLDTRLSRVLEDGRDPVRVQTRTYEVLFRPESGTWRRAAERGMVQVEIHPH